MSRKVLQNDAVRTLILKLIFEEKNREELLQYKDVAQTDALTKQDRLSRKGCETMMLQGTKWDVLQSIADIQQATFAEEVEDVEIAQEIDLDIRLVRNALADLAKEGDVKVEKIKTLSGLVYSVFLTNQGQATLTENPSPIPEILL